MNEERPIRPEESAALTDQLRQAFASHERSVTVHFADQEMRLQRVSQEEYRLERTGAPTAGRVLLSFESIPTGYPEDLPYLPGEIVMLNGNESQVTATWWSRNDQEDLLAQIDRQSLASGWSRDANVPISSLVTHRTYRKANLMRQVMAGQGIVGVSQKLSS